MTLTKIKYKDWAFELNRELTKQTDCIITVGGFISKENLKAKTARSRQIQADILLT
jgi:hypothetical protein